jgi:prolipoprotein diacylglyceryltransferase
MALAAGFPLGMAVGRIGDVINGEHARRDRGDHLYQGSFLGSTN